MGRTREYLRRLRVPAFGLLAGLFLPAHADFAGDPPHTRLAPDLDVFPQNFAIAQDRDAIVYVGNADGVLVFDGERWSLVPLPNEDIVRSLAYDGHDRIYVGGYDAFGYIERGETGTEVYHDLTGLFSEQLAGEGFADIWDVHVTSGGVFFRALRHLFLYDPNSGAGKLWRHEGRFGVITQQGGHTLLQFRGEGLRQFVGGEWRLLPGTEGLKELVWELVPLRDGGLLTLAADGRWRVYRDGRVSDYPMPPGFPPSSSFSAGVPLRDGTVAMISDNGKLYVYDAVTKDYRRFDLDPGYLADMVPAVDGGLLIAGEDTVMYVEWPTPWTVFGPAQGLFGSLHSMRSWNEGWYAMTASGVQKLVRRPNSPSEFVSLGWTDNESWELLPLDSRTALLAGSYSVVLVEDGRARPITHTALYPRVLRRSPFDADVVFVGSEPGFAVMRRVGGQWRLVFEATDMEDLRTLNMIETAPRNLWLGSDRGGVWSLVLKDDYSGTVEARQWGPRDGLEYGRDNSANLVLLQDGTLLATTEKGLFRLNGERFERTSLDGLAELLDKDEFVDVALAPDGARWAFSFKHVYRDTGKGWKREQIASLRRGAVEAITFDQDGSAVFSTSYAVLRHDRSRAGSPDRGVPVMLRAVERVDADGTRAALAVSPGNTLTVPGSEAGLTFRFALPDYRRPDAVRYQARLTGLDARFPDWTDDDTLSYPHIPPGEYRFEVRALDSHGRVSELQPLSVSVIPEWYGRAWAQVLWLSLTTAALIALTLGFVNLRTRRLALEKAQLARQVSRRTSELRAANRQLETMAHLDGLTSVANRRRLDDYLDQCWAQCVQLHQPMSLLAIDVDRFKNYNDEHGHLAGDEVLIRMVKAVAENLRRQEDLLARYGGDEFFVVSPGVERKDAAALAERLRERVEASDAGATVSIGVATRRPRAGQKVEDLVRAADQALYDAKAAGRNRVAVAED